MFPYQHRYLQDPDLVVPLTAISDLTRIATSALVTKHLESRSYFAKTLVRSTPSWTLILGQPYFFLFSGLRIFYLGRDGADLVIEEAGLLRFLGASITFSSVTILQLS